jgi:hypothetical protein
MKNSFAVLTLIVSAAAMADTGGASAPVSESQVRTFAQACFNALGSEKWLDNAHCYERAQLAEFQQLYLQRSGEMAPGVVPHEFMAYYKGDVTLDRLKSIEPAEFFAAFNGGWALLFAPRAPCKRGASSFQVTKIEAEGQNKFQVAGLTTARQVCGEKTDEKTRSDTIAVLVRDGKPSIEFPRQTFELLKGGK